jgi:hypothetical protein
MPPEPEDTNTGNSSERLRIEPLDLSARGIRKIRELMNVVWPRQTCFTDEYLDWEYNRNPAGKAFGFNAWLGDELIGHYASQPIRAKVLHHAERPGLLSLNIAVHPAHRRPRLFFRLADKSFTEGAKAGYAYYTGVPNAMSTHLFIKHWGFQLLGQLEARVGFGEPRYREQRVEYDFARLWTEDELQWRMARPGNPYRLRRSARHPTVLSPTAYPLIRAEFEIPHEYRQLPFASWLAPAGPSPLRIWIGKDPNIDWRGVPRVNLPLKYRPAPLNVLFKDFHDSGIRLDPDRVRYHLIDFDAY